jgi:hypothetical protein
MREWKINSASKNWNVKFNAFNLTIRTVSGDTPRTLYIKGIYPLKIGEVGGGAM